MAWRRELLAAREKRRPAHRSCDGSRFRRTVTDQDLYPNQPESDWLEFDSMVNLRPSFGNRSRGVDDPAVRERITRLVVGLVRR